ncbi:MAG: hypothetical protein ACYC63_02640 [Armatimonadota bacterium]
MTERRGWLIAISEARWPQAQAREAQDQPVVGVYGVLGEMHVEHVPNFAALFPAQSLATASLVVAEGQTALAPITGALEQTSYPRVIRLHVYPPN